MTLTFDLLTPKSIGVFYSIRATTLWSLKALVFKGYSCYWAETVFTLQVTVTLTFDLLTPKSIGVFYSIRAITLWSLKALGQRVLEWLSGNRFHSLGHCDLDLWSTDLKINRGLLLNEGYHPMKFEGSGSKGTRVIERKRSVTDGQTARRTRQKQYVSPEGRGIMTTILNVPSTSVYFLPV